MGDSGEEREKVGDSGEERGREWGIVGKKAFIIVVGKPFFFSPFSP